jgi:hypothetical protein
METGSGYDSTAGGQGKGKKRISPWVWVGCGCGVLLLVGALAIGGFIFATVRQVRDAKELAQDPKALAERIQKIVPYRELPEGYSPAMAFSIPILSQTAIFSRGPLDADGAGDMPRRMRRGDQFIYTRTFTPNGGATNEQQRKRFLDQRQGVPRWLKGLPIPMPDFEALRTGTFKVGGHTVYYRTQRTKLNDRGRRRGFLNTIGIVDCIDPLYTHTVMWNSASQAEEPPLEATGPAGATGAEVRAATTAEAGDPAAMAAFLGHFELCGGR